MKLLVRKPAASCFPPGTELTETDKLRELDKLVSMDKALGEVASRHTVDKRMQQKELALPLGSKPYSTFVRTGLSNAYLAASVDGSSLVRTSKTGAMGKAGEALQLLSGAVPAVGVLAGFAAAALKAGDHRMQTRRVVRITDMATDAVECCSLVRRLALRLTDGLAAGIISTTETGGEIRSHTTVDVGDRGVYGSGAALPDGESEEAVMEWFTGEVANLEADHTARRGTSEEQAGRRLGKRHLRTLLVAVGRGCLEGVNTAEDKVETLLKVIVPEASVGPVKTPTSAGNSFMPSFVSASPHGGSVDREAEFAAMKAKMEALELAEVRRTAELEALQSANNRLQGEMDAVRKRLPKPQMGVSGCADVGGGQLLAQEQKTKTREEFMQEMANPARSADRQTVTTDEFRPTQAHVEEMSRETGHLDARVAALEEGSGGRTKGWRARWRRRR